MYKRFKTVYKIQRDDFTEKLSLGRYETGESSIMVATLEFYSPILPQPIRGNQSLAAGHD